MDQRAAADEVSPAARAAKPQKLPAAVSGGLQSRAAGAFAAELASAEEAAAAGASQGARQGLGTGLGLGRKEADVLLDAVAATLACGAALFWGAGGAARAVLDASWGARSALAGAQISTHPLMSRGIR